MKVRVLGFCVLRSTRDSLHKVVRVTRKYQITLPKEVRERLGIRVGDLLRVKVEGGRVVLEPVIPRRRDPVEDMLSLVSGSINIELSG